MPEVAVLVKVPIAPEDVAALLEYRAKNVKALRKTPGFETLSLWESLDRPGNYLILMVYESEEDSEKGLKVSMKAGPLVEGLKTVQAPPEVRRTSIERQTGKKPTDITGPAFLSLSVRVANPGAGRELMNELNRILDELALIPGHLGSMVCRNVALAEEISGVVFWSDRKAYEASLPKTEIHLVELYKRTL